MNSNSTKLGVALAAGAVVGAGLQYAFGSSARSERAVQSGEVTYEVNLEVNKSVKEYDEWLVPHCKELLELQGSSMLQ